MHLGKIDCCAATDLGRQRSENDDQFLIADLVKAVRIHATSLSLDDQSEVTGMSQGKVFLVADGMGGHVYGRRASVLAVDHTIHFMVNRMHWHALNQGEDPAGDQRSLTVELADALTTCQKRIQAEAEANRQKVGMATTLTIALLDWPSLHVVHAGDSRCYLDRGGNLEQITHDHRRPPAVELPDSAPTTAAAPEGNVVGGRSGELAPEVHHMQLALGDTLLLCTDGLTKHVSDRQIANTLRSDFTAEGICRELIAAANAEGGTDNITVVVARFLDVDDAARTEKAVAEETPPEPHCGENQIPHPHQAVLATNIDDLANPVPPVGSERL